MILRTLYKLFPHAYAKVVFESQRKPPNFEKLQLAFVDSEGKKYFRYMDDLDMPIVRKGHFERCLMEFDAGISHRELSLICDAMEEAISPKTSGKSVINLGKVGYLINEIRNRRDNLIHPEIMFDMVAALYIREDENPGKIDYEIHDQKVIQFKKDSQGGLFDFFYNTGLQRYIPFSELSEREFSAILKYSQMRVNALTSQVKSFTESAS